MYICLEQRQGLKLPLGMNCRKPVCSYLSLPLSAKYIFIPTPPLCFFQYFLAVISLISDTLAASIQEMNATNLVDKVLIFSTLIVSV